MEKINEIFFADKGLTSTSASHLADLAQETILGNETKLQNMSFCTTKLDIVGSLSESGKTISLGYDDTKLSEVKTLIEEIAEMNAFCAWMREAIKAKDREMQMVSRFTFEDWCKKFGHIAHKEVQSPKLVEDMDMIANMNVKERNRYFTLEAIAATVGKYIHPGGAFAEAREDLLIKLMRPCEADGDGKDTLIYSYSPSVDHEKVEEIFFELQKLHRQNERELNRIKFALKKEADLLNMKAQQEYRSEVAEAAKDFQNLFADYKEWQIKETEYLSKLKIVVPDALQSTYDKLSRLEE